MTETIDTTAPASVLPAAPTPTSPALIARPVRNSMIAKKLLARARGATIAEIQAATGWQPHSARAFLSSLRKAGQVLAKEERKSGETSYRLTPAVVGADADVGTGVGTDTNSGIAAEVSQ